MGRLAHCGAIDGSEGAVPPHKIKRVKATQMVTAAKYLKLDITPNDAD